jgi:hypothetical protein
METEIDRVRRIIGFSLFAVLALSLVAGAVLLGRVVGDAVGSAYVGTVPAASDGLPMPPMPPPPVDFEKDVGGLAAGRSVTPQKRSQTRPGPGPGPVVKQSKNP